MRIACIGAGHVGGPTMSVIASMCPEFQVFVCDNNQDRIDAWRSDQLPIYEPGLLEVVQATRERNLQFVNRADLPRTLNEADLIFISVNTPTKAHGLGAGKSADLIFWEAAARLISASCKRPGFRIIVEKSTVPVKTAEAISRVLDASRAPGVKFEVLSNPEFLAEGTAVQDLLKPDRVLIGGRDTESGNQAVQTLVDLYCQWVPRERILTTSLWSSELSKLASNAMLAQRISSINSISALCEETGADILQVSHAIGTDSRIGPHFLNASIGFGGSCFHKDILNLVYLCETHGLAEVGNYFQKVVDINQWQKERFVKRIVKSMFGTVKKKRLALLGWSFKKDTTDSRETPSNDVARSLLRDGADIQVYDPRVNPEVIYQDVSSPSHNWDFGRSPNSSASNLKIVNVTSTAQEACDGSHAICICTEWDEFKTYDYEAIYSTMQKPAFIFDGRNILDQARLREIGFIVYALGRPLDPFLTEEML